MFHLHPQLETDTFFVRKLPLSLLLLSRDSQYPWFILVPRRSDITEIYQLSDSDQQQLLHESSELSRILMSYFNGDKLNVATIGNMVPQLHQHHIVRFRNDIAWPKPVWGAFPTVAYTAAPTELIKEINHKLGERNL